jgi:hypothetical protein
LTKIPSSDQNHQKNNFVLKNRIDLFLSASVFVARYDGNLRPPSSPPAAPPPVFSRSNRTGPSYCALQSILPYSQHFHSHFWFTSSQFGSTETHLSSPEYTWAIKVPNWALTNKAHLSSLSFLFFQIKNDPSGYLVWIHIYPFPHILLVYTYNSLNSRERRMLPLTLKWRKRNLNLAWKLTQRGGREENNRRRQRVRGMQRGKHLGGWGAYLWSGHH